MLFIVVNLLARQFNLLAANQMNESQKCHLEG